MGQACADSLAQTRVDALVDAVTEGGAGCLNMIEPWTLRHTLCRFCCIVRQNVWIWRKMQPSGSASPPGSEKWRRAAAFIGGYKKCDV